MLLSFALFLFSACSGGASVCVKRQDGSYSDVALAGTQQITINSEWIDVACITKPVHQEIFREYA